MNYDTQGALGRSTLASSYPTMTSDFGQASGSGIATEGDMEIDIAAQNNGRFYRAIGETNHSTQRGMLVQAGQSLIQISDWLLTNAVRLGLLFAMEHPLTSTDIAQALPRMTNPCMHSGLHFGIISTTAGSPSYNDSTMKLNE